MFTFQTPDERQAFTREQGSTHQFTILWFEAHNEQHEKSTLLHVVYCCKCYIRSLVTQDIMYNAVRF